MPQSLGKQQTLGSDFHNLGGGVAGGWLETLQIPKHGVLFFQVLQEKWNYKTTLQADPIGPS